MACSKVNGWSDTGFAFGMRPPMATRVARSWADTSSEHASAAAYSAFCNDIREDVGILSVIMAIRELGQVQRQVGFADLMERADHATLEQAPEGFDVVGMDVPAHVFLIHVGDDVMRIAFLTEFAVAPRIISSDQIDFLIHGIAHERFQGWRVGSFDHLADHIAFASDGPNHRHFVAPANDMPFLVPMAVFIPAPDVCFIDFNFAHQFRKSSVLHRRPDAMAHIPRGAVVPAPDLAMNLQGTDAFLGLSHQVDDLEPRAERVVGIFKYGLGNDRKPVAISSAAIFAFADPMKRLGFQFVHFLVVTARTLHAMWPAFVCEELLAGFFSREAIRQAGQGHRGLGHGVLRGWEDYTHKPDVVSSTT